MALLAAVAAAAMSSGSASAQTQIKGRVMVLVDSSGSMVWHFTDNNTAGGDGDLSSLYTDGVQVGKNYYPGTNLGKGKFDGVNSRLYAAKAAVTNATAATGDIDFGLMRYALDPNCPNANYCCTFAAPGCARNTDYIDNTGHLTQSGSCGLRVNNIITDGGLVLVTPSPTSLPAVASWVDGIEDFRDNGSGAPKNPELRANGSTPLAGSARTALSKWYLPILNYTRSNPNCVYDPVKTPLCDPQIDCRPYAFVLATDGADTCDGDPVNGPPAAVQALYAANPNNPVLTYVIGLAFMNGDPAIGVLNKMAANGGTATARFATDQASIEAAFGDIIASSVKVEICDGKDNNCNALVDEGLGVYQECVKGADCASGTCNGGRCSCNGNGQCSNGNVCVGALCTPSCNVGVGACLRTGVKKCDAKMQGAACCILDGLVACTPLVAGAAGAVVCDGASDNDCNGVVDSNQMQCLGKPQPLPEVCDGVDNDLDGIIDNNLKLDVGQPCGLNLGVCTLGKTLCVNTNGQDVTQAMVVADKTDHLVCLGGKLAQPIACNGFDNNCDGIIDSPTRACYDGPMGTQGVGICRQGAQQCAAVPNSGVATYGPCVGEVLPAKEICNGIDDDCNGLIDDPPGFGQVCCPSGKCGVGACTSGTLQCSGGALACVGGTGPHAELCNGRDDDCNGVVDDLPNLGKPCFAANGCNGVFACDLVKMIEVCNPTQVNCMMNPCQDPRVGQSCGDEKMLPLPCKPGLYQCVNNQVTCTGSVGPTAEVCNCADDDCNGLVDDNALCPAGTACVDCGCYQKCDASVEFPCPGGYFCDQKDLYCKPEKTCRPACPANQLCNNMTGTCYEPCLGISCGATFKCVLGRCVGDSCVEDPKRCAACTKCDSVMRSCVVDKCCNVQCQKGQFCDPNDGLCHGECASVNCSQGKVCVDGSCVGDPCAGVVCSEGNLCNPDSGQCVLDRCAHKVCMAPLVCVKGACVMDDCPSISCPDGSRCVTNAVTGQHQCTDLPASLQKDQVVGAGGGGFALGCAVGRGPGQRASAPSTHGMMVLLLGLFGLVAPLRRRRSRSWGSRGAVRS